MAITDAMGHYLEVNEAMCQFLGYEPAALLTMSFLDLTPPDDLPEGLAALTEMVEGRSSQFSVDKRYLTASGSRVWARTTGVAVRDESGKLLRVIVQVEDLTARLAVEAALSRRESYDQLTDLPNRRTFYERLGSALQLPPRRMRGLAVLVVNLDRFHQVNAGLGDTAGDLILRQAGKRLVALVRGEDTVARLGGDEFAMMALGMSSPLDAVALAVAIRRALGRPYWIDGNAIYVSARVGVVTNIGDVGDQALVQMASAAAHAAKSLTGGWSLHIEGADTVSRNELSLVSDLRTAVHNGEITVAYQPILRPDEVVHHFEALARWKHPERGPVPPDQFIVLAEQNGLIAELTDRVMTIALRQTGQWRKQGIQAAIAVNLSGKLLAEPDLADNVAAMLAEHGVPAHALTLEITETALAVGSTDDIIAALGALRDTGVRISIDDFGTGCSSLSYLRQLPVDELKIDRSFILDLDTDNRSERIVRSIIDLAHSLGLSVVAEGVEDDTVASALTALDVDYLQGFALARPSDAATTEQWLIERRTATDITEAKIEGARVLDVLVIRNAPPSRNALLRRLRSGNHRVAQSHGATAALRAIKRRVPDLIILIVDDSANEVGGIALTPQLRGAGYVGPIVLFSGSASDDVRAPRYPMDVWPVSSADESLLIGLVDGYASTNRAG